MRLNRNTLLGALGGTFILAALGISVAVYAQQTSASPQPAETQETTKKAVRRTVKPAPKPQPQQEAQQQQKPSDASTQAAPQPQAAPQQPSVFDEHVRQAKITTCANVFSALGHKVANNSVFTAETQWDAKASDAHSIQSVLALAGDAANPTLHAAGVVFAAPIGQSCEGTLVRVTPTSTNCPDLSAELTKQNGRSSPLGDLSLITLPNGAQVVLIPFGNACIAMSTLRAAG
ncbi:hypothetical protein [Methylovirgula sp. 4M-Z18]|uniref:hypothetical protein n=1 Tax=Methylovirgula sp. 4M-Z18 TaxID=2293567 RepID=UPI000E2FB9CC|nr:hypothetical protein [Methylovirgula sp. 4M-Z18]RFB75609.1 hypothetical protein DYH55_22385 [Methylovirgula sp. 4M-Z18]